MKKKFACILLLLAITHSSKANTDYIFDKLTSNQGLSHNTVYAITQDQQGFIWIGTREGINRYDSYNIKTYYAYREDSLGLNADYISALLTTSDGELLIGTSAGLNTYNPLRDRFRPVFHQGIDIGFINQIYESSENTILICAQSGLYRLNQDKLEQLTSDLPAIAISEYKKDVFWLANNQQLLMINREGEVIKEYPEFRKSASEALSTGNNISTIYKDRQGEIWIGTKRNGLYHYNFDQDLFDPVIPTHRYNPLEVNMIRALSEDHLGNLWIGTESGLFIYNKTSGNFSHYNQSFDKSPHTLNDKAIYTLFRSAENIMWIGTYFGGINFVKPKDKGFHKIMPDGGRISLNGKAISQIISDNQENLWVGTEDGGINILTENEGMQYLTHNPQDINSLSSNNVHAIHPDSKGNIWIGTFLGGLNKYNPASKKFKIYKNQPGDSNSLSNNSVYAILNDSYGNLWVGTQDGLNLYNAEQDNFSQFSPQDFNGKFIYDIMEDHQRNLWFCTRYSGIYHYNISENKITWYNANHSQATLPVNEIVEAYQDSQHNIWFGSLQGGLIGWKDDEKKFLQISQTQGLPNDNVYGILEDDSHNLWLSTNKGLAQYNPKSKAVANYNISHGLTSNQLNFKSSYKNKYGWMYFGTVNGLVYFHPDSLNLNDIVPDIHFTDFKLFNNSVPISEDNSVLDQHINSTQQVDLKYKQNVVTIDFIAINYFSPGNNLFSYYLEGFEPAWNNVGLKRSVTYTNLSPGKYTFHVKVANNDGTWSGEQRKLQLIVAPPWWLSYWAFAGYFIILLAAGYLYWLYLHYQHRQKMALQLERMENEKIKEVNQHKLNFFTYITHEFKTPLTLIIASIDKFINVDAPSNGTNEVKLIRKSATRLHHLIDQLMEFRRVESDHTKLELRKGDIVLFLQDTFAAFIPLFNKKQISHRFATTTESYTTFFDADKLEKIITNLVSNAIKNTPELGEVSMKITIHQQKDQLQIDLRDNGVGLTQTEANQVFLPFYQSHQEKQQGKGSGIGLALVHSLIKFLGGDVKISSNPGEGTHFLIQLPLKKDAGNNVVSHEVLTGNKSLLVDQALIEHEDLNDLNIQQPKEVAYELLIVEDNQDLLKFLIGHYSNHYKVVQAKNGKEALQKMQKSMPDLIISDVMMPEMDGFDLCKEVKTDLQTSHIPVVLLTARSALNFKLEGLDVGADVYLAKPFNLRELDLILKNLLEMKYNLKRHFQQFGSLETFDKQVNNKDQEFLNNLTRIVQEHMDDPDFNITTFTREVGISRSLLHLKLKKLVNMSASEFVKTIRLQKATQLLKAGYTIADVAYQVGFSDPNYFSKSFKEKYNCTPSEYKV